MSIKSETKNLKQHSSVMTRSVSNSIQQQQQQQQQQQYCTNSTTRQPEVQQSNIANDPIQQDFIIPFGWITIENKAVPYLIK